MFSPPVPRSTNLIEPILLLLPYIIPILTVVLIAVVRRLRPGFGFSWLVALLGSLSLWGLLIYFKFSPPQPLVINGWLPRGGVSGSLVFLMDDIAWNYTFGLSSLLLLIILTAPARLQHQSNPTAWVSSLSLAGIGSLAMMAGSPLAVVLIWTALDVYELVIMLTGIPTLGKRIQVAVAFSVRVLGTFFLIYAMIFRQSEGQTLVFLDPGHGAGIFVLISVGLRLGVIPLHLPYRQETPMRRGLGTLLRLTSPMASLVLLARLPSNVIPVQFSPYLLALAGLAALYGAGMWASSKDEIAGRPYWLIAVAGLAVASSIRGYPLASMAWGCVLGISGGLLFLYSSRSKALSIIPAAGAVIMCGLPFTPSAYGWKGLVTEPFNLPDILFILAMVLIIWGYIKHGLRPEESLASQERWILILYTTGFSMTLFSAALITFFGWKGLSIPPQWWVSVFILLAVAAMWILKKVWTPGARLGTFSLGVAQVGSMAGRLFQAVFSLGWFYRVLAWIFGRFRSIALIFSDVIEGEGGVLWVLVLVVLVLSFSLTGAGR